LALARSLTLVMMRKLSVLASTCTSARLSLVRDSSTTTVGSLRTSVWMAYPNSTS